MTKKDGDKLREMRTELMKMADDYRPTGNVVGGDRHESRIMENLAMGIDYLLQGNYVYIVVEDNHAIR